MFIYCSPHNEGLHFDSIASSTLSGKLQKKSMPVFSSNSSIVMAYSLKFPVCRPAWSKKKAMP